ncbi:hypothetical protein [Photorhabdus luminescens]|uniref:Stability determinant domain-containing protein n=1 Tax=Photorhabdus luminescens subsp. mexicana TaxID=2100167 RepID=A0A4R4J5Z1_PHOLU|nr:hypothetical protein [Photorhabdus luminescens]TDB48692.1 hypothetical protein C5468_14995 [Photorhabdus luminescens subsp. mexicana]
MVTETIDHPTLNRLVEAGAVNSVHVVGHNDGWALMVKYGTVERPLVAQRSRQVRLFKRLETLVTYLKDVGIAQFNVDAANYNLDTPTKTARPDRAEALKRTHKAAAYDAWFRKQVQAAIDDPHPSVPHEEAKAQFAAKKAALRKEI